MLIFKELEKQAKRKSGLRNGIKRNYAAKLSGPFISVNKTTV